MAQQVISPREFLKTRRPEKFSDSVTEHIPSLDRALLEYHLDSLTSRSQEGDFEHFARRLAQCEICPNLLPHTGPTGGGDSKVDSETYPVADAISLTWCVGIGREAAQERWAFAFSAMKDWRPKLQSDMAKIAATNRGYRQAFFITNQFVPDRVRAEIEGELSKKHGMDVRVLDRTWILDRVFLGKHEAIAIETLKLQTSVRSQQRKGPRDVAREDELNIVESRIKAAGEQNRADFALVNDCIEAAELARGLELPRTEVEGRLLRAARVAQQCGSKHQQLLAAYQSAWTSFWWYEDYKTFSEQYADAEKAAIGSRNAYDFELLSNLLCNLRISVSTGKLSPSDAKTEERTRILAGELDRLKGEKERGSTALYAESLRLMMDLIGLPPEKADPIFRQFADLIGRSEGMAGFPLGPLVELLIEFGEVFGECQAYNELHEKIVNTIAARSGEVAAAQLLLRRGAQELDADRPYKAIQWLGQALTRLYKHESRHDLIEALYLCANAYERVGLKWAARGTVLTAASIAVNEFWTYAEITPDQAACFSRLQWLEVKLGRLPHTITWHETTRMVEEALENRGFKMERFLEHAVRFDATIAALLLRADLWTLKQMVRFPQTLDDVDLPISAAALRFALGHEEEIPKEIGGTGAEREEFFLQLRDQLASVEMSPTPLLYNERKVILISRILGCSITVETDNKSPCVELAESLLGALEALLSTGMDHNLFSREPALKIEIRGSEFANSPFSFEMTEPDGRPFFSVVSEIFHAHKMSHEAQRELKEKMTKLVATILARVFVIDLSKQQLRKFVHDEVALDRAIEFTSSFVTLGNVLGYAPKTSLDSWIDSKAQDYPLKRTEEWDASHKNSKKPLASTENPERTKAGDDSSLWRGSAAHTQMETVSLIRETLWNQADWGGTFFVWSQNNETPPVLGLMFGNEQAGVEIFRQWRKELGQFDKQNKLRILIVRGINKNIVHAYRVTITSNRERPSSDDSSRLFFMVSRGKTMEPTSDRNLSAFLNSYSVVKRFFLAPGLFRKGMPEPKILFEEGILKREIQVRNAWEIGLNDPDTVGLSEDDKPIIPPGQKNAPVLDALRWRRENRRPPK